MQEAKPFAAGQGQHPSDPHGEGHHDGGPNQQNQSHHNHPEHHMHPENQHHDGHRTNSAEHPHHAHHPHQEGRQHHEPQHGHEQHHGHAHGPDEHHGHDHPHGPGGHEGHGHHHPHHPQFKVDIEVNGDKVVMHKERPTGLEVKQAALEQGVAIQLTFVLQVERANGTSDIIGDTDHVHLHPHQMFTAIAPDDNS